jgi:hypothetical protein
VSAPRKIAAILVADVVGYETANFKVSVNGSDARFAMKEHFATVDQALEVVWPFIRQWEFAVAPDRGPGEFELVFLDAVVEDRKPTPSVVDVARQETVKVGDSFLPYSAAAATRSRPPTSQSMRMSRRWPFTIRDTGSERRRSPPSLTFA